MNRERVRILKEGKKKDGPVVYWMSRDQRVNDNWALLFSQEMALKHKAPLAVVFCLVPRFLGATKRQYGFMLKGLQEVEQDLAQMSIPFYLLTGSPEEEIPNYVAKYAIGVLVTDFDPLRIKKGWKEGVSDKIGIPFYEVDAHNIVPCWIASPKQEYGAYTFRPKIKRILPEFLQDFPKLRKHPISGLEKAGETDWNSIMKTTQVDHSVLEVDGIKPGEKAAKQALREFLGNRLALYDELRNDPSKDGQSNLSPYLHFGHISAQRVALEVLKSDVNIKSQEAFLEELIVRRELSDNFCFTTQIMIPLMAFPIGLRERSMSIVMTRETTPIL